MNIGNQLIRSLDEFDLEVAKATGRLLSSCSTERGGEKLQLAFRALAALQTEIEGRMKAERQRGARIPPWRWKFARRRTAHFLIRIRPCPSS